MNVGSKLFKPLRVGNKTLQHRVILAPLTRRRNDDEHTPLVELLTEHYTQRAAEPGTLLITEANPISPWGNGYPLSGGLYTDKQLAAWRMVVDAVHERDCFISAQLWAPGRLSDAELLRKETGKDLISASNIPGRAGPVPRALTQAEIKIFIDDFAQAARNAVSVGFDFVEIHGANGYLVDQFIQDVSNDRTDKYGGSIENRSRFAVEVVEAVAAAVGPDKVGIRLSPYETIKGMGMKDPVPQFRHLIQRLATMGLAYLSLNETRQEPEAARASQFTTFDFAREAYRGAGPLLICSNWSPRTALEAAKEIADDEEEVGFVFGRTFLSNPDLVFRIKHGLALNAPRPELFYGPAIAEGYTDYPFSNEYLSLKL